MSVLSDLLFKQYVDNKEFVEQFEEQLEECFKTICPTDGNYHKFDYMEDTGVFTADVYLADCCDWEYANLSKDVVALWLQGKKAEAIALAKRDDDTVHDKVENDKDDDKQWFVCYEILENENKRTGRKYFDTENEANAEFDKLYDEYDRIILALREPHGDLIKSCTKGYE